jgi:hypothetical protein
MTPREQDAYIEEHLMGHPILGLASADNRDGVWGIHADATSNIQPVYLKECACDVLADYKAKMSEKYPEIDWVEPKIFGHDSNCLEVVPFYGESLIDAFAMEERIAELDLEAVYSRKLLDIALGTSEHVLDWTDMFDIFSVIHASPAQRAQACTEMLMAIEMAKIGH